jgi:hypothetical protein
MRPSPNGGLGAQEGGHHFTGKYVFYRAFFKSLIFQHFMDAEMELTEKTAEQKDSFKMPV